MSSNTANIVSGGGWKRTRVQRIKVKSWLALLAAIAVGCVAVFGPESLRVYASALAGLSLLLALGLFRREKPREIDFPSGRTGCDPRNLHSACGTDESKDDERDA